MIPVWNNLKKSDSVLMVEMGPKKDVVVFHHKSHVPKNVASVIKVYFGLEVAKRLHDGEISDKTINVSKKKLAGYGTDVLNDLVAHKNIIKLDVPTLIRLMLKYSCNSSTLILTSEFLPNRKELEDYAKKYWKLKKINLTNQYGKLESLFSLRDVFTLYKQIYSGNEKYKILIKNALRESRNIYYLFDQKNIKVLGSKSGTIVKDGLYWISDSGIIEIENKKYFLSAVVARKKISTAVKEIRRIGDGLLSLLKE